MSRENLSGGKQEAFRINFEKQIGEGNTSKVFLAQKGNGPSVYVAKVLRPEHREQERYFQREVNLHKKLRHKNVVLLDHDGRIPSLDLPYFAMARASQGTFLKPGEDSVKNFPIMNAIDYLLQAANGLQYVHDEEIAHNDVQPNNFLLHQENDLDDKLTVWLSDFGIAGKISDANLIPAGHTGYIAPEKTGQQGVVTKSTDLYAFGVTTFQLITGELPFGKPSEREIDAVRREIEMFMREEDLRTEAWEKKHRTAPIPEFTDRWDVSRFPDPEMIDVREALQDPVMKALAKDPSDRHGSVGDFAEDLQQHFDRAMTLHNKQRTTIAGSGFLVPEDVLARKKEDPDRYGKLSLSALDPESRALLTGLSTKTESKPKHTPKKKVDSGVDRRTVLKWGAELAGAGLALWGLVEAISTGISDEKDSGSHSFEQLAQDGISYFQQQGELGKAGEIASYIGYKNAAQKGIDYLEKHQQYGTAGEIAARIGETEMAKELMAKSDPFSSGKIAAILDYSDQVHRQISVLRKQGKHDEAGYLAAFIGDSTTSREEFRYSRSELAGEAAAIFSEPLLAQAVLEEYHNKGDYRVAGRIAAIFGKDAIVRTEIKNIQDSSKKDSPGWAGYLAAEALWWRDRREAQGN